MKNLQEFTDAMHEAAGDNMDTDSHDDDLPGELGFWKCELIDAVKDGCSNHEIHDRAIRLALIAAEIAGRVKG